MCCNGTPVIVVTSGHSPEELEAARAEGSGASWFAGFITGGVLAGAAGVIAVKAEQEEHEMTRERLRREMERAK